MTFVLNTWRSLKISSLDSFSIRAIYYLLFLVISRLRSREGVDKPLSWF